MAKTLMAEAFVNAYGEWLDNPESSDLMAYLYQMELIGDSEGQMLFKPHWHLPIINDGVCYWIFDFADGSTAVRVAKARTPRLATSERPKWIVAPPSPAHIEAAVAREAEGHETAFRR